MSLQTFADYIYCLVRSGPAKDRHRNLSFLLVPADPPGLSLQPIEHVNLRYTLSSDVFFDDVSLPLDAIVGGEAMWNQGKPGATPRSGCSSAGPSPPTSMANLWRLGRG